MHNREVNPNKAIRRLFLHEKPFILLKMIASNDGNMYSAMAAKRIDCSYAYIIKLIKKMIELGIITSNGTSHKKLLKLTTNGKRIYKLVSEI
jgi:predicted transcriptional regulator